MPLTLLEILSSTPKLDPSIPLIQYFQILKDLSSQINLLEQKARCLLRSFEPFLTITCHTLDPSKTAVFTLACPFEIPKSVQDYLDTSLVLTLRFCRLAIVLFPQLLPVHRHVHHVLLDLFRRDLSRFTKKLQRYYHHHHDDQSNFWADYLLNGSQSPKSKSSRNSQSNPNSHIIHPKESIENSTFPQQQQSLSSLSDYTDMGLNLQPSITSSSVLKSPALSTSSISSDLDMASVSSIAFVSNLIRDESISSDNHTKLINISSSTRKKPNPQWCNTNTFNNYETVEVNETAREETPKGLCREPLQAQSRYVQLDEQLLCDIVETRTNMTMKRIFSKDILSDQSFGCQQSKCDSSNIIPSSNIMPPRLNDKSTEFLDGCSSHLEGTSSKADPFEFGNCNARIDDQSNSASKNSFVSNPTDVNFTTTNALCPIQPSLPKVGLHTIASDTLELKYSQLYPCTYSSFSSESLLDSSMGSSYPEDTDSDGGSLQYLDVDSEGEDDEPILKKIDDKGQNRKQLQEEIVARSKPSTFDWEHQVSGRGRNNPCYNIKYRNRDESCVRVSDAIRSIESSSSQASTSSPPLRPRRWRTVETKNEYFPVNRPKSRSSQHSSSLLSSKNPILNPALDTSPVCNSSFDNVPRYSKSSYFEYSDDCSSSNSSITSKHSFQQQKPRTLSNHSSWSESRMTSTTIKPESKRIHLPSKGSSSLTDPVLATSNSPLDVQTAVELIYRSSLRKIQQKKSIAEMTNVNR